MPITQTRTLYTFDELPTEAAKEAARAWFRDISDDSYADMVIEEADAFGRLMGIEIASRPGTTRPDVRWSGFYSQGDGACFTGRYAYKAGALDALKAEAPMDDKLHRIAADLEELQAQFRFTLTADITHRDRYVHSRSPDIAVYIADEVEATPETERALGEILRRYMDWIYAQLEDAYEGENSDESVDEGLASNAYYFDEDGAHVAV